MNEEENIQKSEKSQQPSENFSSQEIPNSPTEDSGSSDPKQPSTRRKMIVAVIGGIIAIGLIASLLFAFSSPKKVELSDLDEESIELFEIFDRQLEELRTRMEAEGASEEDILLAQQQFIELIGSTVLLKLQFEGEDLSATEKKRATEGLLAVLSLLEEKNPGLLDKPDCAYREEALPLQDFFENGTIVFDRPMIYISDPSDESNCSPTLQSADYELYSVETWNSIIFDKSKITERPVAPGVKYTIEKRIKVIRGGLSGSDFERYVLQGDDGIRVVPTYQVFDRKFSDHSRPMLYHNDNLVGRIMTNLDGDISIVDTDGNIIAGEPEENESSNEPEPQVFTSELFKRSEYLKRIMLALNKGQLEDFTDQELIDLDLGNGLYTYDQGKVIHGYGGMVEIEKRGEKIYVLYSNVPAENTCYEFYFINDPKIYGFDESWIDGRLESYADKIGSTSERVEEFKQEVCYHGKQSVNIEFSGDVSNIQSKAVFFPE
jgi:hypothetical protein